MEKYPIPLDGDEWKKTVTDLRDQDVSDQDNFFKQFALKSGVFVKSARSSIPANSSDVLDGDMAGDFYVSLGFLYIAVNNSGNVKWQRVALSDF